jgi:hypothetical protein
MSWFFSILHDQHLVQQQCSQTCAMAKLHEHCPCSFQNECFLLVRVRNGGSVRNNLGVQQCCKEGHVGASGWGLGRVTGLVTLGM